MWESCGPKKLEKGKVEHLWTGHVSSQNVVIQQQKPKMHWLTWGDPRTQRADKIVIFANKKWGVKDGNSARQIHHELP
jgi:uncharacterized membrane protein